MVVDAVEGIAVVAVPASAAALRAAIGPLLLLVQHLGDVAGDGVALGLSESVGGILQRSPMGGQTQQGWMQAPHQHREPEDQNGQPNPPTQGTDRREDRIQGCSKVGSNRGALSAVPVGGPPTAVQLKTINSGYIVNPRKALSFGLGDLN